MIVSVPWTEAKARLVATLLVRLALLVAPVVPSVTPPLSALVALVNVIVALVVVVVKDDAPPTVSAPAWDRLPAVSRTVSVPPMEEAARLVAAWLVRLALPAVPVVFSVTAPVRALLVDSEMVASVVVVVKDDAPPTVSTPVAVRLPVESTMVRLPPTEEAARLVATLLVMLASLVVDKVIAPVSALVASVSVTVVPVSDVAPPTVRMPAAV